MKAQQSRHEIAEATDDILRVAALAAAMRAICDAKQLQLPQQSRTVARPSKHEMQVDFTGRALFGFAFTEGHEATFHVPSGHRFVIEHMSVSRWEANNRVDVRLVTKSSYMFRLMSLTCWPGQPLQGENPEAGTAPPILVRGSTANTFLFSNGEVYSSSTVPPNTYVQVWGYLEPTNDEARC